MATLRSWLRGSSSTASKVSPSLPQPAGPQEPTTVGIRSGTPTSPAIQQEFSDIEDALAAAALIMNDDIEGAEARFRTRNDASAFHQLGLGVATFMKSILSFEKDTMAEASVRLAETEARSWEELKKAQKEAEKSAGGGSWFGKGSTAVDTRTSNIYPPGSEFALVNAQSQLMSAVVAVMHESLTEAVKGFYKLRKAFLTLDAIMEAETKYVNRVQSGDTSRPATAQHRRLSEDPMPGSFDETEFTEYDERRESDGESQLADARSATPSGNGAASVEKTLAELSLAPLETANKRPPTASSQSTTTPPRTASAGNPSQSITPASKPSRTPSTSDKPSSAEADLFANPVDIFIHSGANMCFGVLLLIVSMVPPAFSRILYILGFKGDRDRGTRMLWQSTRVPNAHGAIAALVLLAYYNGLLGFADIVPSDADAAELASSGDDIVGYPRARCAALIADMTAQYPDSRLWRLQEARELANDRRLDEAIAMLAANADSKMKQISALSAFDMSLNNLFALRWGPMREGFLRCVELSTWSHALYYYMVGSAELEMYRDALQRAKALGAEATAEAARELVDAQTEARKHKKAAEEYFRKAPSVAGKKKFMAKQMPLELFIARKLRKWEERAARLGVGLADVPVVSPAMEMVYLCNGSKRMTDDLLERARTCLSLDRCTMTAEQKERVLAEEKDETAIWAVAEAALLRSLGRTDEAREVITPVLRMDRTIFKGPTRDDYALPLAHYEMAAAAWREASDSTKWPTAKGSTEVDAYRRQKSEECLGYLEKTAKWESYVLDGRFGMRIQVGIDSVKWLKGKKGW